MQISFNLSLCGPCACNVMMWRHGTPRPVLEIVLSSVCGLPLCKYLFSHCHCWIAGPLQATSCASSEPAAALHIYERSLKPTTAEAVKSQGGKTQERLSAHEGNNMSQHFTCGRPFFKHGEMLLFILFS